MSRQFHIVDVFAREPYAGNQLAVVTDAAELADDQLQAIAAEFGFSETTFITGSRTADGWPVRIFTPTAELPFAGHPTLGTAAVLRQTHDCQSVVLDLAAGSVPVEDREGWLWMDQPVPTFGDVLSDERLAKVLGLGSDAIDSELPVRIVSTGVPTVVTPLVDLDALTRITLDREAYAAVTDGRDAKLILAVTDDPRNPEHDYAVRSFAPGLSVTEDPATGSANGCLAAYLARETGRPVAAQVEQGFELGRPSLLGIEATVDPIRVSVGGAVHPVAQGTLVTPEKTQQ